MLGNAHTRRRALVCSLSWAAGRSGGAMGYVKVSKSSSYFSRYQVKYRRRRGEPSLPSPSLPSPPARAPSSR